VTDEIANAPYVIWLHMAEINVAILVYNLFRYVIIQGVPKTLYRKARNKNHLHLKYCIIKIVQNVCHSVLLLPPLLHSHRNMFQLGLQFVTKQNYFYLLGKVTLEHTVLLKTKICTVRCLKQTFPTNAHRDISGHTELTLLYATYGVFQRLS
jgi:hypothetical protein